MLGGNSWYPCLQKLLKPWICHLSQVLWACDPILGADGASKRLKLEYLLECDSPVFKKGLWDGRVPELSGPVPWERLTVRPNQHNAQKKVSNFKSSGKRNLPHPLITDPDASKG